jgi:solute:Na+ symporter, SSS family
MNLHIFDWLIVATVTAFFTFMAYRTRRLTRSVADFMAANRCAGRYLLAVAYGISSLGAITVIAEFQKYYKAGFTAVWWSFIMFAVTIVISASGWVIYRYRETRVFTLAQFFETRYSKKFRIFCGILGFSAGIVNFGIFPAVGSRFFLYFCGLPHSFTFFGFEFSTFLLIMATLLIVSLYFTFCGGQIAVITVDFLQGIFCNIVFIIILVFMFIKFDWATVIEGLNMAPADQSRINPFQTGGISDFNLWFFLILAFTMFYGIISWQGQQGYFTSSKSPHEQKMAMILANWRFVALTLLLLLISLSAFVVMHHPKFSATADTVNQMLSETQNLQTREQIRIPLVLVTILPTGLIGAFCAVMVAAFISTHDTYLHTWGSIFIQDVVMPFRKKPFDNQTHMKLLRASIIGVAAFVFLWSWKFQQSQDILMYFQITGAIFTGGVGSAIIGGLYWKKGTTAAAWAGMLTGGTLATTGVILIQIHNRTPFDNQIVSFFASKTGAVLGFWSSVVAIIVYIVVSLLTCKRDYNLDKLLHRGEYAVESEKKKLSTAKGLKALIGGEEFTLKDRLTSISVLVWGLGWFAVFLIGTIWNAFRPISNQSWERFWSVYVWICMAVGTVITIWFTIGGFKDLKSMFSILKSAQRDVSDDGMVNEEDKG